jgi:hypothetical protein
MSIYERAREIILRNVPTVSDATVTVGTRHQNVPTVSAHPLTVGTHSKDLGKTNSYQVSAVSRPQNDRGKGEIHSEEGGAESLDFSSPSHGASQVSLARAGDKRGSNQYPYKECGHSYAITSPKPPPANSHARASDTWDTDRTRRVLEASSRPVSTVFPVKSVRLEPNHPDFPIVAAIRTGDPARISTVVASNPDLGERAAIREIEGRMSRPDAEIAVLHDVVEERGYAI